MKMMGKSIILQEYRRDIIMNGFEMQAYAYRQYLEKNPTNANREYLEKQIRVYDFLGSCSEEEICMLYDSGAFNDITRAYCKKAMTNMELSKKDVKTVDDEIYKLHDLLSASEILK